MRLHSYSLYIGILLLYRLPENWQTESELLRCVQVHKSSGALTMKNLHSVINFSTNTILLMNFIFYINFIIILYCVIIISKVLTLNVTNIHGCPNGRIFYPIISFRAGGRFTLATEMDNQVCCFIAEKA